MRHQIIPAPPAQGAAGEVLANRKEKTSGRARHRPPARLPHRSARVRSLAPRHPRRVVRSQARRWRPAMAHCARAAPLACGRRRSHRPATRPCSVPAHERRQTPARRPQGLGLERSGRPRGRSRSGRAPDEAHLRPCATLARASARSPARLAVSIRSRARTRAADRRRARRRAGRWGRPARPR